MGAYWSSTLRGPVICESRLELAGLLFADFEPSVRHIVAQPFFLRATVDQKVCKHVPDHLLITDEALSLWMSSLSVAMADPKVAFAFEWTREVVEARGWRYEVATEPSAVELGNVRFLSARGGAQKLVIRSPDPNDVGTHTGCRSGEVRRITTQRRQSGGACVSGRGGVHGDRDRGADRLFQ